MKKRGIKSLTLGILGGLILSLNVNATTMGIVNVENLNVRSGPSTTSSKVGSVHFGDKLELLSKTDQWYKINIDVLNNAYVHSSFINLTANDTTRIILSDNAELRNSPNLLGDTIDTITKGNFINIVYQTGDWYYVSTLKGKGYMHSNNFTVPTDDAKPEEIEATVEATTETPEIENNKFITVTTSILNVRQEASANSNKIGQVYRYNTFNVISELEDWVSIKLSNGNIGYISKSYVEFTDGKAITSVSKLRQDIVNYALQFKGNPYVYGGNSLTKGVDCSGFTQQIMKHFGVSINRTASTQAKNGTRISKTELLPGDLVFYGYKGKISHVGLYMGNGQVIHANNRRTGIIVSTLEGSQMLPYISATRVIN